MLWFWFVTKLGTTFGFSSFTEVFWKGILIQFFLGYSNGQVHKFNMQSGIYRGHYGKEGRRAHKGALRGVETDLCNQRVITVGADDRLKFWHFKDGMLFLLILP